MLLHVFDSELMGYMSTSGVMGLRLLNNILVEKSTLNPKS